MKVIDIHTHGIGGYDTKAASPDDVLRIADIQGSHGVSEVLLTIYPSSIKTMRRNMETVRKAIQLQQEQKAATGKSAKIIGLYLEGPFLNPSRRGSLDAKMFIEPSCQNFEELIEGYEDITRIIAVAPEMKGAVVLIKKLAERGMIVTMGHSDATFAETEAGFHAGARGITHIFNAMRGFHHREPGIAGFGLLNQDIYIEVIADPHHLHPKTLELIFIAKNPERIIIISDAVRETWISQAKQGITDDAGRLTGGCMTITESSERLIQMGFDAEIIKGCITKNPGRYLTGR
jgi:N-acetylglucosamine-6-phosphate deacetylase